MASITPRKDKSGTTISFQIKVSRGRDPLTRKQLTPFTTTYTPPVGWSDKAIQRDLTRFVGEFEAACVRGEIKTKEQIKAEAQAAQTAAEAARMNELRKPTFDAYIDTYCEDLKRDHAIGTVAMYRLTLKRAAQTFGTMKLESVDHLLLREYVNGLATGKQKTTKGKQYAHDSVKWHVACLHAFFEHAMDNDLISVNPMDRVKCPRAPKEVKSEKKSYSDDEVREIITKAAEEPLKWYTLIVLAFDSYLRRGEIAGLKWENIDFATGACEIINNAQYTSKETGLYITSPKGRKNRTVYLSQPTINLLRRWKIAQAELYLRMGWKQDYVFTCENKPEPLNANNISNYFKSFGRRIGYPELHPHAARRTSISLSLTSGEDLVSVSERAGHANPSITLKYYARSNDKAQRKIASTIGQIMSEG